jgi:hypothetical protein
MLKRVIGATAVAVVIAMTGAGGARRPQSRDL